MSGQNKRRQKLSRCISCKIENNQTGGCFYFLCIIITNCHCYNILTGCNVALTHSTNPFVICTFFFTPPGSSPCLLQRSEPRWGAKPCTLRSPCTRPFSSQTTPSCRPSTLSPLTSCRGCTASALCKLCTWTTGLLVTRTSKDWGRRSRRWQPPRVWWTPGFPSQRYPSQRNSSTLNKPALRTACPRCTRTDRGLTSPTWPSLQHRRTRRKLRIWRS